MVNTGGRIVNELDQDMNGYLDRAKRYFYDGYT